MDSIFWKENTGRELERDPGQARREEDAKYNKGRYLNAEQKKSWERGRGYIRDWRTKKNSELLITLGNIDRPDRAKKPNRRSHPIENV